jgi:hypothetical protein
MDKRRRAVQSLRQELVRRRDAGEIDADEFAREDARLRPPPRANSGAARMNARERIARQKWIMRLTVLSTVAIFAVAAGWAVMTRAGWFKRYRGKRSDDGPRAFRRSAI